MILKNYNNFIKENLDDNLVKFNLSDKFIKFIEDLKELYKIIDLFHSLKVGVNKEFLLNDPVDYLDIDDDYNVSFLKSNYFDIGDVWSNTRRQKSKINRVLKLIFNEKYLNSQVLEVDVEKLSNRINVMRDKTCRVEEFRGIDILRAYNYNKELTPRFGHSCANFNQKMLRGSYREPHLFEYDVYVNNPDNCGAAVVWDDGKIQARLSFQQGLQLCDTLATGGKFKKGEICTVYGNLYGVSGKYHQMLKDYLINKYKAVDHGIGGLCIEMETRWKQYPAFDSMYVCLDHNLLSDKPPKLPSPYRNYIWHNTYPNMDHLKVPDNYIQKRIEEKGY